MDDIAASDSVVVSADTLDSRNGGGCLPTSRDEPVEAPSPGPSSSSSPPLLDVERFRFPLELDSAGLAFCADFERRLLSLGVAGESWMLNM